MKKLVLLIMSTILFVSCYSQKVSLNSDKKSGIMTIEYFFDDDIFQILSLAMTNFSTEETGDFDPLVLIDEELFKEKFENKNGIRLKEVFISTGDIYRGKIVIQFDDFEKAIQMIPQGKDAVHINKENSQLTLSQVINLSEMDPQGRLKEFVEEQKVDDVDLYDKLVNQTQFNFELNTQTPILKAEGIKKVTNHKAVYSFYFKDLLDNSTLLKFLITI